MNYLTAVGLPIQQAVDEPDLPEYGTPSWGVYAVSEDWLDGNEYLLVEDGFVIDAFPTYGEAMRAYQGR